MSANNELRRLLDELGVEWSAFGDEYADQTLVHTERFGRCAVTEWPTGLDVHLFNLTPEQAVEVTLGRGTCRMTEQNDGFGWWECSECGGIFPASDIINYCPNCGRKVVVA